MMSNKCILLFIILLLFACKGEEVQESIEIPIEKVPDLEGQEVWDNDSLFEKDQEIIDTVQEISALEKKMLVAGLVDIQTVDSTIQVDVKYATTDNFMGQVLYPDYHKVYLQPVVAERLSLAQKALQKIDSSLTLLVFDGTRPR